MASGVHFLNRREREVIILEIVTQYPHLKDRIGSGLVRIIIVTLIFMHV